MTPDGRRRQSTDVTLDAPAEVSTGVSAGAAAAGAASLACVFVVAFDVFVALVCFDLGCFDAPRADAEVDAAFDDVSECDVDGAVDDSPGVEVGGAGVAVFDVVGFGLLVAGEVGADVAVFDADELGVDDLAGTGRDVVGLDEPGRDESWECVVLGCDGDVAEPARDGLHAVFGAWGTTCDCGERGAGFP